MLRWLFPSSCPCDAFAKAWIEQRLQWLSEQFGAHGGQRWPLFLPTAEFFPDRYDYSDEAVRTLLDRVCGYMDVDPARIELQIVAEAGKLWLVNEDGRYLPPGAAGTFHRGEQHFVITVDEIGLGDPMGLVGTIAHELAHVRLLGENRHEEDEYDCELLTDLAAIYFGFGIFLANSPRQWDSTYTKWPGSDFNKPEYMTRPMIGYALAHVAWFRGDTRAGWRKHLHSLARPDFNQALQFLSETGQSQFKPEV